MKKQVIAFLMMLVMSAQFVAHFGYMKVEATEQKVIPDEAIRLRILANSDSEADQALKRKVRDRVKAQIDLWVADLQSIEEARRVIQSRIPELEQIVATTLREEESSQVFTIKFSKQVKFPTKVYGNFLYPAGEYEAVLVTLGAGEGANWWCVLFPPLCFLDFSSGTAVPQEDVEEVQAEELPAEEVKEEKVKPEPKQEEKSKPQPISQKGEQSEVKEPAAQKEEERSEEKKEEASEELEEEATEMVVEEEEPEVKFFVAEMFSKLFE